MTKINRTFRLDQELSRALDKICVRHGDKTWHLEQALSAYGPIKQLTAHEPKPVLIPSNSDVADGLFDRVWDLYGRKGNRKTSKARYLKLALANRDAIDRHLPAYIASTPDKQYRKGFEVYINQECWNDEVIQSKAAQKQADTVELLTDRDWAKDLMEPGNTLEHDEFYK